MAIATDRVFSLSLCFFALAEITVTAACLSGCAATASPQEVAVARFDPLPKDHQQQIKERLSRVLKDPYSAVYRFESPRHGFVQDGLLRGGKKHFGWIVLVYVNAKNSYGGYTGEEPYLFIFSEGVLANAGEDFRLGTGGYVP